MAADAQVLLAAGIGGEVGVQVRVRDVLEQPRPIRRSRDAQRDVALGELSIEIVLRDRAVLRTAGRIDPPSGDEQRMDSSVAGSAGREFEVSLANRPVRRDERRQAVASAEGGRHLDLRIHRRRGAAVYGLTVAAAAAVEIEPRPEPIPELLHLGEGLLAVEEERGLVRCQALNGITRARTSRAGPGIGSPEGE